MADYAWNVSTPASNLLISGIPAAISDVKDQLATRIDVEHTEVVSGADDSDSGGQHKKGSGRIYHQSGAPTKRPDAASLTVPGDPNQGATSDPDEGSAISLDTGDKGRMWFDPDDSSLSIWNGSAWTSVSLSGGVSGGDTALLAGRTGSTTIYGSPTTDQDLKLAGNSAAANGTVEILAAGTDLINFNDIPVAGLLLNDALNANSKRVVGVDTAVNSGDSIALGAAVITSSELKATGSVAEGCTGTASGSDSADLTANVGFAADVVIVANTGSAGPYLWIRGMGANNKNLKDGTYTATERISVSGDVLTFPMNLTGGNDSGKTLFYVAFRMNKTVNPA